MFLSSFFPSVKTWGNFFLRLFNVWEKGASQKLKQFSCPEFFFPDRLHTKKKSLIEIDLDFNIVSGLSDLHMRKLSCIYFFEFHFLILKILKSPEFCFQDGQK